MDAQTLRHRHAILAPLFLVAVAISAVPAAHKLPGSFQSTVLSPTQGEGLTEYKGIHIIQDETAHVQESSEQLSLLRGGALFSAEGLFSVEVSNVEVVGLSGAFHVVIGSRTFTISALSSPVLVTQGNQRMLIPVGFRWEHEHGEALAQLSKGYEEWSAARRITMLPQHFVEEQLRNLRTVDTADGALPPVADAPERFNDALFLLPGAAEIARETWDAQVLGALRRAVEQNDAIALRRILTDGEYQETLRSPEGIRVSSILLSTASGTMRMELLNSLLGQEAVWMIAALHPAYRDAAWSFGEGEYSAESTLVRLMQFPHLDGSSATIGTFAFGRWSQAVKDSALHVDEPVELLERYFHAHAPLVSRMKERGYPERAGMLEEHLKLLFDGQNLSRISESTKNDLLKLQIGERVVTEVTETIVPVEAVEQIQHIAEVVLPSEDIVRRANTLLREAKALFTVETKTEAVSGTQAKVMNVLFAGATQDRMVSFVIDVVDQTVSAVEIDGKTYPFDSEFSDFIPWVTR